MSSFARKVQPTYGGMPVGEWLDYMKKRYDGIPVNKREDCLLFEVKGIIPGSEDVNNYHIPSLHAVPKKVLLNFLRHCQLFGDLKVFGHLHLKVKRVWIETKGTLFILLIKQPTFQKL